MKQLQTTVITKTVKQSCISHINSEPNDILRVTYITSLKGWIDLKVNNFMYTITINVDEDLKGLPLINSPLIVAIIVCLYLLVVLKWGPNYMKNRSPYNLKTIILLYNASQVFLNIYIFYVGLPYLRNIKYFELSPDSFGTRLTYYYAMLKLYDLIETVMFVLKKKQNQVTFLHVYHHVLMVLFTFIGIRISPGGHNLIYGLLNIVVHAIMYTYYFLSVYNSKMAWLQNWKKYMTQIQLVQFVLIGIHYSWPLYYGHCSITKELCIFCLFQDIVMIVLFGNFYIKTYIKKRN